MGIYGGYIWCLTFKAKTAAATFWATFGNNWATLYSNVWSRLKEVLIEPPSLWQYLGIKLIKKEKLQIFNP